MLRFELPDADRALIAANQHAAHAAIALLANRKLGVEGEPRGIFKHEGGVVVRGKEIAVQESWVIDDWAKPTEPTEEEKVTVAAIEEVVVMLRAPDRHPFDLLTAGLPALMGDPLRALCRTY